MNADFFITTGHEKQYQCSKHTVGKYSKITKYIEKYARNYAIVIKRDFLSHYNCFFKDKWMGLFSISMEIRKIKNLWKYS